MRKHPLAECETCPLAECDFVPTADELYDGEQGVVVVGEAPGTEEVNEGTPFVGRSGKLLKKVLKHQGINPDKVLYTNAVLCHPPYGPDGKQTAPNAKALAACRERLMNEVREARPTHVIALGAVAAKAVLKTTTGITALRRGRPHTTDEVPGAKVIPTFHTAAALRVPDHFPSIVSDIGKINRVVVAWEPTRHVVANPSNALALLRDQLDHSDLLAGDIELDEPFDRHDPNLLCFGVSHQPGRAVVYPNETIPIVREMMDRGFEHKRWAWQNGKFDIQYLWSLGLKNARVDEDTMLAHYACHVSGTKILLRDLTWKNIENLDVGDELVAPLPKSSAPSQPSGVLGTSTVTRKERIMAECFEVVTERRTMVVSADHLWPVNRAGNNALKWVRTDELYSRLKGEKGGARPMYRLPFFVEPWEADTSYEAGYIAGILDGEGSMAISSRWGVNQSFTLTFSQKAGPVLDRATEYLRNKGFEVRSYFRPETGVYVVVLQGRQGVLRALGMFRPSRFMADTDKYWQGPRKHTPIPIIDIRPVGPREVVAVSTTTNTFIADGFLSHNCDERKGVHDLEQIATEVLGAPFWKEEARSAIKEENTLAFLPKDKLYAYNAADADITLRLMEPLTKEMASDGTEKMYRELLIPASDALAHMEYRGVRVDTERLEEVAADVAELEARYEERTHQWVENPRSPKQVMKVLQSLDYDLPDTRADTIRVIEHPFVAALLDYRAAQKINSTYVKGIYKRMRNGRIHPTFLIHGTETGRTSCRNPNLQNVPVDHPVRGCYTASEGNDLIEADYAQIELRVLATLTRDPWLREQFLKDRHIHKAVATALFGPNYDARQYITAKSVSFGIAYGETPKHLAHRLDMKVYQAKRLVEDFYRRSPKVREYRKGIIRQIQESQHLTSVYGRKRRFWLLTRDNAYDTYKEGVNFTIQSAASDIMLSALIKIHRERPYLNPIINVHDSLMFDVPEADAEEAMREVVEVMESVNPLDVPIKAEAERSFRWKLKS